MPRNDSKFFGIFDDFFLILVLCQCRKPAKNVLLVSMTLVKHALCTVSRTNAIVMPHKTEITQKLANLPGVLVGGNACISESLIPAGQ
jgi:hypothetical protein